VATLSREIREVQNPALGSILEWRFTVAYTAARHDASGCPIILLFLVLPLLFHEETLTHLATTQRRSGLRTFASKFTTSANNESDVLLLVHDRALRFRSLSLDSLRAAVATRLIAVDINNAVAFPLSTTRPRLGIAESVRGLVRSAEKLGQWCAELTILEISSILHVRF
jgi:hypothetical protein